MPMQGTFSIPKTRFLISSFLATTNSLQEDKYEYQKPKQRIVEMVSDDIIATSGEDDTSGFDSFIVAPGDLGDLWE